MKNQVTVFLTLLLLSTAGFSQSNLTSVSYNKASQPGLMLELPYGEEVSEGFIVSNLKKTGYDPETKGSLLWKSNKVNGFYTFKGVRLEGLSESLDLYFKVEQKSRKQKDQSIIYMLVSKGGESFANTGTDEAIYGAAKKFLNAFIEKSAAYKLDLDIKAQEEAVSESEKKLAKLKDQERSLNKKIEELQNDLKKNRDNQLNQEKAVETERKKLGDLKGKA